MALGVLLLPVAIILPLVWGLWRPWSSRWLFEPLQETASADHAVFGGVQPLRSFGHRSMRVHATLNRPFRWLQGEPFSIPWSEISWEEQGAFGKFTDTRKATVDGRSLTLPDWVYEAAQQQPSR